MDAKTERFHEETNELLREIRETLKEFNGRRRGRDWFQDVLDFHQKLAPGIVRPLPSLGEDPIRHYSLDFIAEEFTELQDAARNDNLEVAADSLVDLIYVAIRCAIIWGIDLRPVWDEVHRANMKKEGGEQRTDGKILKPEGWLPPDVAGVLKRQSPLTNRKAER